MQFVGGQYSQSLINIEKNKKSHPFDDGVYLLILRLQICFIYALKQNLFPLPFLYFLLLFSFAKSCYKH